jgi:hypothetical protein
MDPLHTPLQLKLPVLIFGVKLDGCVIDTVALIGHNEASFTVTVNNPAVHTFDIVPVPCPVGGAGLHVKLYGAPLPPVGVAVAPPSHTPVQLILCEVAVILNAGG